MKPITFPEQTTIFAENQPQYTPLPAFKSGEPEGHVISCWKLSFKERIRLLITGKIWMSLMMFGEDLTPSLLTTKKSDVLISKTTKS